MVQQLLDSPAIDSQKKKKLVLPDSSLVVEQLPIKDYEKVLKITDKRVGLQAVIAIHNTTLGPALGGTRVFPYAHFNEALEDALRLAKGMTYKSALAEVGWGGGKSVIMADRKAKTPELLRSFGAAVEQLKGAYICAEDLGSTTADMKEIRKATQYVVGLSSAQSSGDPAPFTAWGVFRGVQSAVKKLYGTDSLEGRTVAIQGLGAVGSLLAELLFWAGAKLILSDIDREKMERLASKYAAQTVPVAQILKVECDVLSPCALGAIINDETLPHFRCKAIAGAANNQLLHDRHAMALRERGILYAPDFVINAGGLLNVSAELEDEGYNPILPRYKAHHIYDTLLSIYEIADKNRESTNAAAIALAEYRIKYGIGKRVVPPTFHHAAE